MKVDYQEPRKDIQTEVPVQIRHMPCKPTPYVVYSGRGTPVLEAMKKQGVALNKLDAEQVATLNALQRVHARPVGFILPDGLNNTEQLDAVMNFSRAAAKYLGGGDPAHVAANETFPLVFVPMAHLGIAVFERPEIGMQVVGNIHDRVQSTTESIISTFTEKPKQKEVATKKNSRISMAEQFHLLGRA